jgi:uncharacterized membrane protein
LCDPLLDELAAIGNKSWAAAVGRRPSRPRFMLVFIGTGGIAVVVAVAAYLDRVEPWLLVGALTYVIGVVLITGGGNVPLNNRLDRVTDQTLTCSSWTEFARPWTVYSLRTVAAAVASLAFMIAAFQ